MDTKRTSAIGIGTLALALVAFVGGFALAWVLRGQTIVAPVSAPEQPPASQQLAPAEQPAQQEGTSQEGEPEQGTSSGGGSSGSASQGSSSSAAAIDEDGEYTSPEDVALYIHTYGHLPSNYVSKTKAKKAGWVSNKGNLWDVLPGMSIGGSEFYNDEGQLPDAPGRTWTECDVNYKGGYRGAERIVFSDDGLIFYTDDHYETFTEITFD